MTDSSLFSMKVVHHYNLQTNLNGIIELAVAYFKRILKDKTTLNHATMRLMSSPDRG